VPNSTDAAEDTQVHQVPTPVLSKIPRITTSGQAATSQSLPPADASGNGNAPPRKVRGKAAIPAFLNKFSHLSTADDPESESPNQGRNVSEVAEPSTLIADPPASQPGAFRVDEINAMTQTRTNHTPNPVSVPANQSRLEEGITQSEEREYMVQATLVSQRALMVEGLMVAEIVEPMEEEFWRQRKVQRYALLFFFLATAGLAIGVGVALSGGGG
jgi:hypothetical protein